MYRVGDFSRLGQVSVKTLHHYDEIGLLRPAWVDNNTGYRYYSADQLTTLHRILTFKSLGFSLQEITEILRDTPSNLRIEHILRYKVEDAKQTISREQIRVSQIETWLKCKEEDIMPKYDVLLKILEPQLVASIRERMKDPARLGELFQQVADYITAQGAKQAGPGVILYCDTEYSEDGFTAEAAFPVSMPIPETEQIKVYELPHVENAACLVYKGTHEAMGEASRVIAKWIEDNGYRIAGPNRVVFLDCGEGDDHSRECVVETQYPLERA